MIKQPQINEFKVNDYIILKLEERRINIYVAGRLFNHCKFLLMNLDVNNSEQYDEISSIDEAAERLDISLERPEKSGFNIPPETEFWGHCSNIQTWSELNYDTRLLHSNLTFPLLKELSKAGDPVAKKVFKNEIAKRLNSGFKPTIKYLIEQGYVDYLSSHEFETIIKNNESIIKPLVKRGYWKALDYVENEEIKKELYIIDKGIEAILKKDKQIRKLDLSNNQLKSIPETIGKLENLEELNLSNNQLKLIPETTNNLTKLIFSYLPETTNNLTKLIFSYLPETIKKLKEKLPKCKIIY
ncbi:hypothetical protein GF352_03540 [archaeon]|nr:hypothetical protein [archaeon]